ncbi:MAG TPA: ferritin-like domain-containing protein [Polyangiaceae bacterium]
MTRARLSAWHTAVFSALGIGTLVNCGGASERSDEADGSEAGSAGVSATGGTAGTGGASGGVGGAAGSAPGGVGGGPRNLDFQRCTDPMPVVDYVHDVPVATGLVRCAGGWLHRVARGECPSALPRAEGIGAVESGCTSDADCIERPEGWCYPVDPNPSVCGAPSGRYVGQCRYGCVRDEDCESGAICTCGEWTGQCVPSGCGTDADCNGFFCASGSSYGPFTCQTASDECMTEADCAGGRCNEARQCEALPGTGGVGGTCGRPFLVAGEARTADALGAPLGWFRSLSPDIRQLSSAARARLVEHWTELARMEHASVAAFARFTLELVSLGAPAALVEASQRAMGDEIEHARLCFGLASAYAGREIGPGRLSVEGALDDRSFETIVRTAILEACVGETLAAVEAEDAAERATDPEVRRVLARIAGDEARHAELGFRFLGWALGRAEPALRERLARALGDAVRSELAACDALVTRRDDSLSMHGMPSNSERRTVRELALREIVEPAARSLSAPN